jgi:lactate dehydrogenase-like 2-hydroxyacid dehydrogenase
VDDGIDKAKATAAGLLCEYPGTLDDSVAELAMLMIAAAARHLTTWRQRRGVDADPRTELRTHARRVAPDGRSALARIAGQLRHAGHRLHAVALVCASG